MNNLSDHLLMYSNRPKIYFLMGMLVCFSCQAYCDQPQKNKRQEYIDVFAKYAIQEMREYHIPASITMAQACLESGDGNSPLALKANNHFGIKCKSDWMGPSVKKDDDSRDECFRKYGNALESYRDHSKFLTGGMRYQFLFDYDIKDYKKWAYGLKRAGYATDPQYPERLLKIIEEFQLYRLDEYYNSQLSYTGPESSGRSFIPVTKRKWGRGANTALNPYAYRKVEKRNGSKAFFAKKGDTYNRISAEFSLKEWEIYKYNDVEQGAKPEAGSIVYLQRKRGQAPRGNDFHTLKQGESLWSVAQWYGIRLNALYRKNGMTRGEEPAVGQQISLRKKVRIKMK